MTIFHSVARLYFFIILIPFSILYADPLLVVVLMVKNEAHVMEATLKPCVDAGIDSYLIFDTGSTDETVKVTQDFFKKHAQCKVVIKQEPFINYAASRNRALELAEESFPEATFMVMPDAEWYLHNGKELVEFCKKHKDEKFPAYHIWLQIDGAFMHQIARLLRCSTHQRFEAERHEALIGTERGEVAARSFYFAFKPSDYGNEKTRQRSRRDVEFFTKEYEKNPNNPRSSYYVAQAYFFLQDWESARIWHEKRLEIKGDPEEDFIARYRLAFIHHMMGNWEKALTHYLLAYDMRPARAEPLVRIAEHYLKMGNKPLCYLFAHRAMQTPYPVKDKVLVEQNIYDYIRYDLVSCTAASVGEYAIGEAATREALKAIPDSIPMKNNLIWYEQKKSEMPKKKE